MTNIKSNILSFVEKNKIHMIPRWKVVLYSLLGMLSLVFTFALLVFIGSLMVFVLSKYGFMYLPLFGLGATLASLQSIPLVLFLLAVMLVIIVEVLARQYDFTMRKPIFTTLLLITLSAIIISFFIALTPIHRDLRQYAKDHNLDFVSRQYDRPVPFGPMKGLTIIRGVVIATSTDTVTIQLFDETTKVVYASTTDEKVVLPETGDDVIVFGQLVDERFEAVRIRPTTRLPFEERIQVMHDKNREALREINERPLP